jgi:hypothetical protein
MVVLSGVGTFGCVPVISALGGKLINKLAEDFPVAEKLGEPCSAPDALRHTRTISLH